MQTSDGWRDPTLHLGSLPKGCWNRDAGAIPAPSQSCSSGGTADHIPPRQDSPPPQIIPHTA